jgi:hypothetical protein
VPGLGAASIKYLLIADLPNGQLDPCRVLSTRDAAFTVSGKGVIELSASHPTCQETNFLTKGAMEFTVTGGSGIYTGASGGGTVNLVNLVGGALTDSAPGRAH